MTGMCQSSKFVWAWCGGTGWDCTSRPTCCQKGRHASVWTEAAVSHYFSVMSLPKIPEEMTSKRRLGWEVLLVGWQHEVRRAVRLEAASLSDEKWLNFDACSRKTSVKYPDIRFYRCKSVQTFLSPRSPESFCVSCCKKTLSKFQGKLRLFRAALINIFILKKWLSLVCFSPVTLAANLALDL